MAPIREEIVLDIETQNSFEEVGEGNYTALKVSTVGVYFYKTDTYKAYMENEMADLERELSRCSLLIGFNHVKFDLPVLQPYFKNLKVERIPCLDILEYIRKIAGHRVSLNSVAGATLNAKKSGHGLDAIKYWRAGEIDKLVKYCLDDVKITREVYEYGLKNKEIFFTAKDPKYKTRVPVEWGNLIKNEAKQLGLF